MDKHVVITISREYGSGGRNIGKALAERLKVGFYDKELIAMAAKDSGLSAEFVTNMEDNITSNLFLNVPLGSYYTNGMITTASVPTSDTVFSVYNSIIKDTAGKGSCVIVGRCANYILRENSNCFNIFIHADFQERVRRAVDEYKLKPENAEDIVKRYDKLRFKYHEHYCEQRWGEAANYHLTIDSGKLGIEGSVNVIENAVNQL